MPSDHRFRELIRKTLLLVKHCRARLAFVLGILSMFTAAPTSERLKTAVRVLLYVVGAKGVGLV